MSGSVFYTRQFIASSSNGRTRHSGCWYLGSNPGEAAIKKATRYGWFFLWVFYLRMRTNSESKCPPEEWADDEIIEAWKSRNNPGEAAIKKATRYGWFFLGNWKFFIAFVSKKQITISPSSSIQLKVYTVAFVTGLVAVSMILSGLRMIIAQR